MITVVKNTKNTYSLLLFILFTATVNALPSSWLTLLSLTSLVSLDAGSQENFYFWEINAIPTNVISFDNEICILDTKGYLKCNAFNSSEVTKRYVGTESYAFIGRATQDIQLKREDIALIATVDSDISVSEFNTSNSSTVNFIFDTNNNQFSFSPSDSSRLLIKGGMYTHTASKNNLLLYGNYRTRYTYYDYLTDSYKYLVNSLVLIESVDLTSTSPQSITITCTSDAFDTFALRKCVFRTNLSQTACIGDWVISTSNHAPGLFVFSSKSNRFQSWLSTVRYPIKEVLDINVPKQNGSYYLLVSMDTTDSNTVNRISTINESGYYPENLALPIGFSLQHTKLYGEDELTIMIGSYLNNPFFGLFNRTNCDTSMTGNNCSASGWHMSSTIGNTTNISISYNGIAGIIGTKSDGSGFALTWNILNNTISCTQFIKIEFNITVLAPVFGYTEDFGDHICTQSYTVTGKNVLHNQATNKTISYICKIKKERKSLTLLAKIWKNAGWYIVGGVSAIALLVCVFGRKSKSDPANSENRTKVAETTKVYTTGNRIFTQEKKKRKRKKTKKRKRISKKSNKKIKSLELANKQLMLALELAALEKAEKDNTTNNPPKTPETEPSESKESKESSEVEGIGIEV